jgi:hypothetical protein
MNLVKTGIGVSAGVEKIATTYTYVSNASKKVTLAISAQEQALQEVLDSRIQWSCWVRYFVWNDLDLGISCVALWTESAVPLPQVPPDEVNNSEAMTTITNNSHLF